MTRAHALLGLEHKYDVQVFGHSGDSHRVPFVDKNSGHLVKDRRARLDVVREMFAHSNYCYSGDNTLACSMTAIEEIRKEEGDDYYVFLLSDANLAQYGVNPKTLADTLLTDPKV